MTQYAYYPADIERPTNTLGLAGFICSLVGLLTGGHILSPVGLILSLIALGRSPRGFAIAGLILGLLGTCGWLLVAVVFGGFILAMLGLAAAAAFIAMNDPERAEITVEMGTIAEAVEKAREDSGYLPAAITSLGFDQNTLQDPWGNPYIYTFLTENPGYDIISNGKDGAPGTLDDIKLSGLDEMWANYVQIKGDDESGRMTLHFGEKSIVIQGDDQGGNIKVNAGDRIIEITGNDDGGRVNVTSTATSRPSEGAATQPEDAPAPPDPPQS